ncbi:1-phosphatidylinositol 4,5-bisphosphate phosphodiesterase gamma-1-like [Lethenteron reissneri]|uniref:1-phosphatidylinositol 4,5-bisphosphate phosphodiesterase gamma-1-like n=1 Tax=Lethenteron reissneri TaxID=7753 RepID=UPI002AB69E87|nr:1-phosphatidylinositol 4,5-bisphosphate phosphodiesterase gamma-1-like [Lethenteron reissneri]
MWRPPPKQQSANSVLSELRLGSVLTLFRRSARPEKRTLQVDMRSRQVVWSRTVERVEGKVDIREIKEIRNGKQSRDFERCGDDIDDSLCLVIFYGSEFRLKTLSLASQQGGTVDRKEVNKWMNGLKFLMEDCAKAPTSIQTEWWLQKQFIPLQKPSTKCITEKELKMMLSQLNYKATNPKVLKDRIRAVETKDGTISFEKFSQFYVNLLFDEQKSILPQITDRSDQPTVSFVLRDTITIMDFQRFLLFDQKEAWAADLQRVRNFMNKVLPDPKRSQDGAYFKPHEFLDFLFSWENSVWDQQLEQLHPEDLNNPLSHYFISSSHNTYLTGDQISSESSTEAYARCLRMGCRCIELDCWDGPDNMPIIYHGHTLTTKIGFSDVVFTIKQHAFTTSEFPLILSIEQHCSLAQQQVMADIFRKVFGDMLLTRPLETHGDELPSPSQLKGKIIIKHKTIDHQLSEDHSSSEYDISDSIKNGIMYLEDPLYKEWNPHFFVLTSNCLYYSEETSLNASKDEEQEEQAKDEGSGHEELHFSESWFHGRMAGGRKEAERLLKKFCAESAEQDGAFLVRESERFRGEFSISFWYAGRVQHCRIHSQRDVNGEVVSYSLLENLPFDSLYNLVAYYRQVPLRWKEIEMQLSEPVPQPNGHEKKDWYHSGMSRGEAEFMLMRVPHDGAFLVRKRSEPGSFAITFRSEGKIKHCRVQQEGRLFLLGSSAEFESLVELVSYYEKQPLYRKTRLRYPINEETLQKLGTEMADLNSLYRSDSLYVTANNTTKPAGVMVKTLYDYQTERSDELSFLRNAIIRNVDKQDESWWKGDYGGKKQLWFPSNYVEEVANPLAQQEETDGSNPLGSLQKGTIDIPTTHITVHQQGKGSQRCVFTIEAKVMQPVVRPLDVAVTSQEELFSWVTKIRETANHAGIRMHTCMEESRRRNVALQMSELVVYCRPVPFDKEKSSCRDMSSLNESKAEKVSAGARARDFLAHNARYLSRIYPKGQRIDSSNYDPVPMWLCGTQMVALNFQTPDKPMQLNEAFFCMNGRSGYLLKPECMLDPGFNPRDSLTLRPEQGISIQLILYGARRLPRSSRSISNPFVEVEICGAEFDSNKFKTEVVPDNGLSPTWAVRSIIFDVLFPELTFLRFVVYEEDIFSDSNFLAQATFPVRGLKTGFRSVPLKNGYNEDIELASLLIHIDISSLKEEDNGELYSSIQQLRARTNQLSHEVDLGESSMERAGGRPPANYEQGLQELYATQSRLMELTATRSQRLRAKEQKKKSQQKDVDSYAPH